MNRTAYRQHCAAASNDDLVNMLIGVVLANGFGHRNDDLADVRDELMRRLGDPITRECDACTAEAGEPCRPDCLGAAAARDEADSTL